MGDDMDGCELDFCKVPTADVDIEKWLDPDYDAEVDADEPIARFLMKEEDDEDGA
jgi:hypothetical protein